MVSFQIHGGRSDPTSIFQNRFSLPNTLKFDPNSNDGSLFRIAQSTNIGEESNLIKKVPHVERLLQQVSIIDVSYVNVGSGLTRISLIYLGHLVRALGLVPKTLFIFPSFSFCSELFNFASPCYRPRIKDDVLAASAWP